MSRHLKHTLVPLTLAVLSAFGGGLAHASSHREAPFITTQPKVDGTDFYMFRSYEPGRDGFVTFVANYLPLQDAYGGPNYFTLDPAALYEIHIDQNGDGKEDLTFQFRFRNTLADIQLPVGGKNVSIPLIEAGPLGGANAPLNVKEQFTVDVVRGDRRGGKHDVAVNAATGGVFFDKPTDFIGAKSFGSVDAYNQYAAKYVQTVNVRGCATPGRVFVGQRRDPFAIALGKFFDLLNINPTAAGTAVNNLSDKNITAIALEMPIACVTAGNEPVIGAWTTASLRQASLLRSKVPAGLATSAKTGGAWVQVSRLGMPLVNELVIGLKDKDRFNGAKPKDDGQFIDYVTNPTAPALVQALFPIVTAPTNFPRQDLVNTFLTGFKGVNQPQNVVPSEMLRLNTAIPVTPAAMQKPLGVLAGDNAGFPNGRRPGDDIVTATLRVAMGVLCTLNDKATFGCVPADALSGSVPYTADGTNVSAGMFSAGFPYLAPPLPGDTAN